MFTNLPFIKSKSRFLLTLAIISFSLSLLFSAISTGKNNQITPQITKKISIVPSPGDNIHQNSQPDNRNVPSSITQKNKEPVSQVFNPPPTVTPIGISPTMTPSPMPTTTATPTPLPNPKITLEIIFPSETLNLSEEIKNGSTVCDLLSQAKDEGKIQSLTIDNSYLPTLKSAYVYEINGYKNNWTFTVNETSPRGCSLSFPKPNDIVVWKFSQ